eukprot:1158365-Pelagomonas_calceolata.AAC.8
MDPTHPFIPPFSNRIEGPISLNQHLNQPKTIKQAKEQAGNQITASSMASWSIGMRISATLEACDKALKDFKRGPSKGPRVVRFRNSTSQRHGGEAACHLALLTEIHANSNASRSPQAINVSPKLSL